MDFLALLRTLGSLGVVLGLLAGALWAVRRYDLKLPGAFAGGLGPKGDVRRVQIIERLAIDARHSVALIRHDDREHLVMLAPQGPLLIEGGIDAAARKAAADA
ncbi:MAG: flagellar biosynthetic protein FliO [Sphingomonas sp.]|nr:flagellar biosynthetic protein FliO [Sphingomonas sp.]MDX3885287.1 flagellar biosynthetic protein FliO [Sphingomonas sp.]